MDCSPPGSSVHEILQARILGWVAISFSRGSSQPKDQTRSPVLQADSLPTELQGKPFIYIHIYIYIHISQNNIYIIHISQNNIDQLQDSISNYIILNFEFFLIKDLDQGIAQILINIFNATKLEGLIRIQKHLNKKKDG